MTIYGLQWDTVGPLPFTAALHAYYYNGAFATRPVVYGRGRVWIDVTGAAARGAFWLDVESGDATPGAVPGWLDSRHGAGLGSGGIYCNRSTLPAVIAAAGARSWSLWLATLDGTIPDPASLDLPAGVTLAVVQAFPASMIGFNADLSVVVDRSYWQDRAVIRA